MYAKKCTRGKTTTTVQSGYVVVILIQHIFCRVTNFTEVLNVGG